MKLIALAVSSIVDANFNQSCNAKFSSWSTLPHEKKISRELSMRSKTLYELAAIIMTSIARVFDRAKEGIRERQAIDQLLNLNGHLKRDIGITDFDLRGLESGALSFKDLEERRKASRSRVQDHLQIRQDSQSKTVRNSILELESANQEPYEITKCC